MNITKCANNHFFDREKFPTCPHCAAALATSAPEDLLGTKQSKIATAKPQPDKLSDYQNYTRKTTGFVICVEGIMTGEGFILREGENHIGRSANMDVALIYEPSVSRIDHALITYHHKTNKFTLESRDIRQTVLHNHKPVQKTVTLSSHDLLTIGNCQLVFLPFCDDKFQWPEPQN